MHLAYRFEEQTPSRSVGVYWHHEARRGRAARLDPVARPEPGLEGEGQAYDAGTRYHPLGAHRGDRRRGPHGEVLAGPRSDLGIGEAPPRRLLVQVDFC